MDISQYLEIFIDESKEHLQGMNTSLLKLEKQPSDNRDVVNEVFRSAHTLKGMAATMGFKKMNLLTHDMEDILSEIRIGKMSVNAELLDILFNCLDTIETYVNHIVETGSEGDAPVQHMIDALNALLASQTGGDAASAETAEVKAAPEALTEVDHSKHHSLMLTEFEKNAVARASEEQMRAFGVTLYLAETCVMKSARVFIIFRTLERLGSIIKSKPMVQDLEDGKFDFDFSVIVVSKEPIEVFQKELGNIAEVEKVYIDEVKTEAISTADASLEEERQISTAKSEKAKSSGKIKKPVTNRTVRVDIERLDTLMNLVSELIIIKNGLETVENKSNGFTKQIDYLEHITTNLHDAVMKVRMVPIERVFNRFPRLIRDLSRKLNKQIVLHISGEETELDRIVIDDIGDPLVHLIRNAAGHGLETPDVRISVGKDPTGNIHLTAYQDGNNVVIEVGEDGAGIDVDKVRHRAINNGNITATQAERMSDEEIIDLLFRPSFSMADKISEVSGRGVGLDVVKTKVEALGGDIEVMTELGRGSTFIIRLPLTVAIIQALMIELNGEKYAIPLSTIQKIEEVKLEDIKYVQNAEVIHLRGNVIPIIRLHEKLDIMAQEYQKDTMTVVVVNKGGKFAGLVVDALIGQQEIVIKTLGRYLTNIKTIAGATILGDGEVALILDVSTLV